MSNLITQGTVSGGAGTGTGTGTRTVTGTRTLLNFSIDVGIFPCE